VRYGVRGRAEILIAWPKDMVEVSEGVFFNSPFQVSNHMMSGQTELMTSASEPKSGSLSTSRSRCLARRTTEGESGLG
jgi:hypothetical protein